MSDEQGKTIAEIYGLTEHDPWQKAEDSDLKKQIDEAEKQQKELIDRLIKEGVIPDPSQPEVFTDPEDNEDLTIREDSIQSVFYRMSVPNRRLIDLVTLEPTLEKLALTMKNTSAGCWLAFTSRKIARKMLNVLASHNIGADLDICDQFGKTVSVSDRTNRVTVDEWRPWKPVGQKTDVVCAANEFFYCIADYNGLVKAFFVPETYWNEHRSTFDGNLEIDKIVESHLKSDELPFRFIGWRGDLAEIKTFLDRAGFQENLMFQAYINDQGF